MTKKIKTQEGQAEPVADQIAKDLEKADKPASVGSGGAQVAGETPLPIDITKLSKDQLQTLKSMLSVTPDSQRKPKRNPQARLRRIGGKLVEDFKNAYLGLINDTTLRRDVEKHLIPVRFFGETNYTDILYSDFISSEQVSCEILKTNQRIDEIVEGETISRETGLPVEMIRKIIHVTFIVKLPDGKEVEIQGKLANA